MAVVKNNDNMHPNIDSRVTVFLRDQSILWHSEFIKGSSSAIEEVIPANSIDMKSIGASTCPIGPMVSKILGSTINTSPVPSLTSWAIGVPEV